MSEDGPYTSLRNFLAGLRIYSPAHFEAIKRRGLTLASLAKLSPDQLNTLELPRGPLVRIRNALAAGLWTKFEASSSSFPPGFTESKGPVFEGSPWGDSALQGMGVSLSSTRYDLLSLKTN